MFEKFPKKEGEHIYGLDRYVPLLYCIVRLKQYVNIIPVFYLNVKESKTKSCIKFTEVKDYGS